MRPVHIVILLLGGALGGALIMKVANVARSTVPTVAIARAQPQPPPQTQPQIEPAPVPAPAAPVPDEPKPAPAAVPVNPKPSPAPIRHQISKPSPFRPLVQPASDPQPVERPAAAPPLPPISPTIAPPPVSAEPEIAIPGIAPVSAPPAPQPHQVTLNAGLLLPVRLVETLSSERNAPGDNFLATLDQELVVEGFVIAERGTRVEGRVVAVDRANRVRKSAALAVELTQLHTSDGQTVPIHTDSFFKHADRGQVDNATKIAGGAIIGAVIGGIAGGGKGAAIGAGVGVGAGTGDVLLTRGKPAELASEARVTFRLKSPVPLTEQIR
jgi:hypothetical protein